MKRLRVGFIIDNLQPNIYTHNLINFVSKNNYFDSPIIITGYKKNNDKQMLSKIIKMFKHSPTQILDNILKSLLYRLINKIEMKSVLKRFPKYNSKKKLNILETCEIIEVEGFLSKSNLFLEFTDNDLLSIANCKIDCIIRCGTGILKGKILDATEFGVLSFHHGDNRVNRGGPSGFWEALNHEPSTGFIIQKLNKELDGGIVLYRGNLMTEKLWFMNNAILLEKSNSFLKEILLNIAIYRKLPRVKSVTLHGNKLYRINNYSVFIKYLMKIDIPAIFNHIISKFLSPMVNRWSIAYSYHDGLSKSLWRYKEIPNPFGRSLADPFVFEYCNANYIFVEDFCYKNDKGRISVIKIDGNDYQFLGVVLEESFHLSFPFVFKNGDTIYMVPESSKNSDIRLYKCIEFPNKWELNQILMSNILAADTMLIKKQDTWFMLTNICSSGIGDHNSELHIFYNDNLNSNTWQPIASGNPVIFDSLKGRNGGIFYHEGKIYRVNQVNGYAHYGKSFNVNEILKINRNKYLEKVVSSVEANFKNINSTHHFSANKSIAAVDFARFQRFKLASKS